MSELQILNHPEFQNIRTMESETGQTLFCASDVARVLGYLNPNNAVLRHCKKLIKKEAVVSGKIQAINFIEEPDAYRLIIRSKLPSSVKFENFLFEEVLPSIRKHGMYLTEQEITTAEPEIQAEEVVEKESTLALAPQHLVMVEEVVKEFSIVKQGIKCYKSIKDHFYYRNSLICQYLFY